jgi:hypothetical protein
MVPVYIGTVIPVPVQHDRKHRKATVMGVTINKTTPTIAGPGKINFKNLLKISFPM